MYYTYILKCIDGSYYVGSTADIKSRLKLHNSGRAADFTAKRIPCKLIWLGKFNNRIKAVKKELELKKFSRKKKEKLVFSKDTIWQHYKGNKYIVLGQIDDIIIYSDLKNWEKYYSKRKAVGNETEIYARDKDQWLDWVKKDNKKLLRFQRVLAA